MKLHWLTLICLVLLSFFSLPVSAHPGRTDRNGGHTNHSTGEYHYHHGYSAHQHENGVCPYDYDVNDIGDSSFTTEGNGKDKNTNRKIEESNDDVNILSIVIKIIGVSILFMLVMFFSSLFF